MAEANTEYAIWTPGWYELDQSLELGQRQKFWFFEKPPESYRVDDHEVKLVFYNLLDSPKNCVVRYAKILEMTHPELGPLARVDTDGLDYIFFPIEGDVVVVNAEEEPGQTPDGMPDIDNWSVLVKLSEISDPMEHVA